MRSRHIIFSILLLTVAFAADCLAQSTVAVDTVKLWDEGRVPHADETTLLCFRPANPNGVGVIVCPGGSYYWLDVKGEGFEVARWLNEQGITAYVLLYRTASVEAFIWHYRWIARGTRQPDMITDAQRAMHWVYGYADKYGVDRSRIGMMGFSAGGHLVMSSACFHKTRFLDLVGIGTNTPMRPAFVAPIYPVVTMREPYVHKRSRRALLGDDKQWNKVLIDSLSLEFHIPADCPPVFLVNCKDDPVVDYHNSELLDSALTKAGIPHVYHQYEAGKHGFGVSEVYGTPESRQWKWEFLKWLKEIGILY